MNLLRNVMWWEEIALSNYGYYGYYAAQINAD